MSSPPSLLRRRRCGVAGYIAPKDTSPDAKYQTHHKLYYNQSAAITLQTTSSTSSQPSSCRRPPQPVHSHQAADDLRNLSTAIELQTTSTITCLRPSRCGRPLLQPVYGRRATDDLRNPSTAIALRTTSTTTATTTATLYYTTPHYRRTADAQRG